MISYPQGLNQHFFYGWIVVGVTTFVLLISAGIRSAPGVFLLPVETSLQVDRATVAFSVSLGLLLYGDYTVAFLAAGAIAIAAGFLSLAMKTRASPTTVETPAAAWTIRLASAQIKPWRRRPRTVCESPAQGRAIHTQQDLFVRRMGCLRRPIRQTGEEDRRILQKLARRSTRAYCWIMDGHCTAAAPMFRETCASA